MRGSSTCHLSEPLWHHRQVSAIPEQLYTLLLEYRGGTYISQFHASSVQSLLPVWTNWIAQEDLNVWGLTRADLAQFSSESHPVPLEGLQNAWCCTGCCNDDLLLLNIVNTRLD